MPDCLQTSHSIPRPHQAVLLAVKAPAFEMTLADTQPNPLSVSRPSVSLCHERQSPLFHSPQAQNRKNNPAHQDLLLGLDSSACLASLRFYARRSAGNPLRIPVGTALECVTPLEHQPLSLYRLQWGGRFLRRVYGERQQTPCKRR